MLVIRLRCSNQARHVFVVFPAVLHTSQHSEKKHSDTKTEERKYIQKSTKKIRAVTKGAYLGIVAFVHSGLAALAVERRHLVRGNAGQGVCFC